MHRRPHIRGATWDIRDGFQSKLDLIMQLTDERSLELLVIAETCLSGGTRFTEKSDLSKEKGICNEDKLSTQYQRSGNMGNAKSASNPSSLPAGLDGYVV